MGTQKPRTLCPVLRSLDARGTGWPMMLSAGGPANGLQSLEDGEQKQT